MQRAERVTEFVIMSGPDVHDYLVKIRSQLRSYLAAAFPEFKFSLVSQDEDGMGFMVVPVVGTVGEDIGGELREPSQAVLAEIRAALEAFRPDASTVH